MAGMARGAGAARAGGAAATAATDVGSGGRLSLSLEPARCHKSSAASGAGSPLPPPPRFPLCSGLQVLSPPSFQPLWGRLPSPLLLSRAFLFFPGSQGPWEEPLWVRADHPGLALGERGRQAGHEDSFAIPFPLG